MGPCAGNPVFFYEKPLPRNTGQWWNLFLSGPQHGRIDHQGHGVTGDFMK